MPGLMPQTVYSDGQAYGVWFYKTKNNTLTIHEVIDLETGRVLPESNHDKILEELEQELSC